MNGSKAATGIEGLDGILRGGFPRNEMYLIQGNTGSGKTTLGLQFLLQGAGQNERVLYLTMAETEEELNSVARSHGWSLENVAVRELSMGSDLSKGQSQTVFHPAEVELKEVSEVLLELVQSVNPSRVVFDSLSEIRLMSGDALRYRHQILALKRFFTGKQCTVLLLDNLPPQASSHDVPSLVHGIVLLEQIPVAFGTDRRRLRIQKMRGTYFHEGYHDFSIKTGGLQAFPRLLAAEHREHHDSRPVLSGIAEMDSLLGGGLDSGSSSLLLGPAGVGKSTIAIQYATAAAARGERVAMYIFEERLQTLLARAGGLGINLREQVESGLIGIRHIDPAELSPGEFVRTLCCEVEKAGVRMIVIDSLNGLINAMPNERILTMQLRELLTYLGHKGVTTIFTVSQHGIAASNASAPVDLSYLADNVILFRYYELAGEVRQAISILKKRSGFHERTIRDLHFGKEGIQIGRPLREFQGVLTGMPVYTGNKAVADKVR